MVWDIKRQKTVMGGWVVGWGMFKGRGDEERLMPVDSM